MEFFMMKKTAIALGIAAMTFGAQAADLINTEDNKFELNVDVGAYYQSRTTATTGVVTSQLLGKGINQIQLRNTKTLPNGWKIIGQAELDYDPVGDNAPALSDDMRVAVDVPVWGRISAGQFDSFYEDNIAESLGFWGIGDLGAFAAEPASTSDGKRLQYYNKYGDLQVVLDATFGYATSALTSQEIGVVGTVAYKIGDLQLFVGGGYVPSYYSDAGTATQNTFKTVNNSSVVYTNVGGITATYTMGATKLAASMQSVTAASGAIYAYNGAAVEQTIDAWKLGLTMLQVNEGAANQFTQYGLGINYTIAPKAIVFMEANSLGATNTYGNAFEFGMKYTF
jgi:hypothetical protein